MSLVVWALSWAVACALAAGLVVFTIYCDGVWE